MLTTTSSDHDPSLAAWTSVHTDSCDGYCHARRNVAPFSAAQRKNPMRTNDSASGIAYRCRPTVKCTHVRLVTKSRASASTSRASQNTWDVKKFR
jgi:hypothetical protein